LHNEAFDNILLSINAFAITYTLDFNISGVFLRREKVAILYTGLSTDYDRQAQLLDLFCMEVYSYSSF